MQITIRRRSVLNTLLLLFSSFIIPFLTALTVYASSGMAPWGDKSVLIMDMSDQYVAFFAELRNIVQGQSSIFFSWSKSFGCNFTGVFAYYIASPLSFFTLLFPPEQLPIALMWLTFIKIGLAGLAFAVFLKFAFGKKPWAILLFSCCYALMSYSFVYSLSIMWLDGLILLPVILLGVERLLKKQTGQRGLKPLIPSFPWLMTAALAMMFVANYYISYMIGLFTFMYFLLRFFAQRPSREFFRYFWRFCSGALLGAGLAAWLLLPTAADLFSGRLASGRPAPAQGAYCDIIQLLKKLLPERYDSITNNGLPSVYCGLIVPFAALIFFCVKSISWKEKFMSMGLIAAFALSLMSKPLDYIWHGFQYPMWFPFRNAFLFSAFLIFIAYRGVCELPSVRIDQGFKARAVRITACAAVTFLTLLQLNGLYLNGKAMISGLDKQFGYKTLSSYTEFYASLEPLVDITEEDESFYRTEKTFERSKNDAMTFGYKGITHYASAYNGSINSFTKRLGFAQAHFWNSYYGSTPITDSLFNVKYIMSDKALPGIYEELSQNDGITLYRNPFALPLGFMASSVEIEGTDFQAQSSMLSALSGIQAEYFIPCEVSGGQGQYEILPAADGPGYMFIPNAPYKWGEVYVDGVFKGNYFTSETNCLLYLGELTAGKSVTLTIRSSGFSYSSPEVCVLDTDALSRACLALSERGLEVESYGPGWVNGRINAGEGSMFTSIPYDKGFTVKIDGEKIQTYAGFDTFLCFDVPEGAHEIRITYSAPGAAAGGIITALSLALCAAAGVFIFIKCRSGKTE